MSICVAVKHGEVLRHRSFISALFDWMDCRDQRGAEYWWEETKATETQYLIYYTYPNTNRALAPLKAETEDQCDLMVSDLKERNATHIVVLAA